MSWEYTRETIYKDAMFSLGEGAALWHPEGEGHYRDVKIGDVGYFAFGAFTRMFNVMNPPEEGWESLPEDYEYLMLSTGPTKSERKPMIKMSRNISLKSPAEAKFRSSAQDFPRKFEFFSRGGRGAVLITFEDAVTEEIAPNPEFEAHLMKNYKTWIDSARENYAQILREDELVFVRGHTKAGWGWVLVVLEGFGTFTIEVNEHGDGEFISKRNFKYEIRCIYPPAERHSREQNERRLAEGEELVEYVKDKCLFVKYYTMKKRLLGPYRAISV